jgi:alkylation response protein AidB-like acyl-CoA dehydrogenase
VIYTQDPVFGQIIDFAALRQRMKAVYDHIYPNFNLLGSMRALADIGQNDPNIFIAGGASMLAYMQLVAAEEHELAATLKDKIFTLGWTEEHTGSDLLSVRTQATPLSDDPDEREYHIKGSKWIINNGYHADYHIVVAKIDPEQDGPRSLSLFLVPRSSTCSHERLETHVLKGMVLAKFNIDGPGRLLGKVGHGLSIIQRMAMPSKYQCSYVGMQLVREAIPATIEHLAGKRIFGDNPINFSNVFRQLYNIVLQAALIDFMFYRALVFNVGSFLQFHGTMLKSFLLLRANELLSQNWLVAGSKGFLKASAIGRNAIDSFVLPVFDGHYTINTLMTAKHMQRYLNATERADLNARIEQLRGELYQELPHDEINHNPRDLRKPDFVDYADYIEQMELPLDLKPRQLMNDVRDLLAEIEALGLSGEAEYRYKTGDLLHWMESLLAACELWKVSGEHNYLNLIIQQYNKLAGVVNNIISEGGFSTPFMMLLRQLPLPKVEDARNFLLSLADVRARIKLAQVVNPAL